MFGILSDIKEVLTLRKNGSSLFIIDYFKIKRLRGRLSDRGSNTLYFPTSCFHESTITRAYKYAGHMTTERLSYFEIIRAEQDNKFISAECSS